jgi:hypothetical protein
MTARSSNPADAARRQLDRFASVAVEAAAAVGGSHELVDRRTRDTT